MAWLETAVACALERFCHVRLVGAKGEDGVHVGLREVGAGGALDRLTEHQVPTVPPMRHVPTQARQLERES